MRGRSQQQNLRDNPPSTARSKCASQRRKMRRIVLSQTIVLLSLVTGSSVAAAPQHRKGTTTLTGVVLGPDDRPVPHAVVTSQSSGAAAPHPVQANPQARSPLPRLRPDT